MEELKLYDSEININNHSSNSRTKNEKNNIDQNKNNKIVNFEDINIKNKFLK